MPYSLSEEQIDFILSDIRARGVELEKLQINLLDHICTIIERDMKEGDNFEVVYQNTVKQFFEKDLKEIEKETKSLLKNRHYYKMKKLWYFILFVSLGYNVFMGAKVIVNLYSAKKMFREIFLLKNVTLQDGYKDMSRKLQMKYPDAEIKKYVCVNFLMPPHTKEEFGIWDDDTSFLRKNVIWRNQEYKSLDSLAGIYTKNVSYVFAFQKTDKLTNDFIAEKEKVLRNSFFLNDMNILLSGFQNYKKSTGVSIPQIFIVDSSGRMIYDAIYPFRQTAKLAKFLKTLEK